MSPSLCGVCVRVCVCVFDIICCIVDVNDTRLRRVFIIVAWPCHMCLHAYLGFTSLGSALV